MEAIIEAKIHGLMAPASSTVLINLILNQRSLAEVKQAAKCHYYKRELQILQINCNNAVQLQSSRRSCSSIHAQ